MNNAKMNQKLACGLWALTVLNVLFILLIAGPAAFGPLNIIASLLQLFLGYIVYRDRNDTLTAITVVLITLMSLNFAALSAFIIRLVMRKSTRPEGLRKYWYIPAVIAIVCSLLGIISYFSIVGIINLILNALYYLIFGYWFIYYLV